MDNQLGTIYEIQGAIYLVKSDGSKVLLQVGDAINEGDTLSAEENSNLLLSDGLNLDITADGVINVTKEDFVGSSATEDEVVASGTEEQSSITQNFIVKNYSLDPNYQFVITSNPTAGSVINNDDGSFSYLLGDDFDSLAEGEVQLLTFDYQVLDGSGVVLEGNESNQVTIVIIGTNDAPVAMVDTGFSQENSSLTLDVLANDVDVDTSDTLTLTQATASSVYDSSGARTSNIGSVSIVNNQLVFQPGTDFDYLAEGEIATLNVSYTVSDNHGAEDTSVAIISIIGTNDSPVAVADSQNTTENVSVTLDVVANDSDVDNNDNLTVTNASITDVSGVLNENATGNGLVRIENNQLVFEPGSDFDYLAAGDLAVITLSYTIEDSQGSTSTTEATVTITGTNDAPVLVADVGNTSEANSLTIDVLSNDSDADLADALSVSNVSIISVSDNDGFRTDNFGTVQVVNNKVVFNPSSDFDYLAVGESASVVMTYTVTDSAGATADSTITVSVTGTNGRPVASPDTGATDQGSILVLDVLANDTDPESDVLTLESATITGIRDTAGSRVADSAVVNVVNNTLQFNPGSDFDYLSDGESATVTVSYTVNDGNGEAVNSVATITVTGTNDAPVAVADSNVTSNQMSVIVDALANDTDADANSVLTITDASISNINDANGDRTTSGGTVAIVDGKLVFDPGSDFDYLAPSEGAIVTVSYTVTDETGLSSMANATINIIGAQPVTGETTENAPVIVDVLAQTTGIDPAASTLNSATIEKVIDDSGERTTATGIVSVENNKLIFEPSVDFDYLAVGETAMVNVEYVLTDENGNPVTTSATITVTGENDGPIASVDSKSGHADSALIINVLANDVDFDQSDNLSIDQVVISNINDASGDRTTAGGSVSILNNQLVFEPNSDFDYLAEGEIATVTVDYQVSDQSGAISNSVATITLTGTNQGPVAVADVGATDENNTLIIDVLNNDTDVDLSDTLTLSSVSIDTVEDSDGVRVNSSGSVRIENNQLVFEPGSDFDYLKTGESATVKVNYVIQDSVGKTSESVATITVTGSDDVPVAVADIGSTEENTTLTVDVLKNDTDADANTTLIISEATILSIDDASGNRTNSGGTVSVVNNKISFVPGSDFDYLAEGETASVNVSYSIRDENNNTSTSTLTITVTGTNDFPEATADAATTGENSVLVMDVVGNDIDADGSGSLTLTKLTVSNINDANGDRTTSGGIIGIAANKLIFDPRKDFDYLAEGETATMVVAYEASDESGGQYSSTATITITGSNDLPIVEADTGSVDNNTSLKLDVLANDSDKDSNDSLTLSRVEIVNVTDEDGNPTAVAGTVRIETNQLVFEPSSDFNYLNLGENATVTVEYDVVDNNGGLSTSTATITVLGTDGSPILTQDTANTSEYTSLTIDVLANDVPSEIDTVGILTLDNVEITNINDANGDRTTSGGSVRIENNQLVFEPGSDFESLDNGENATVTVSYTVSDSNGKTATSTVTITVQGANGNPILTEDTATGSEAGSLVVDVLANDLPSEIDTVGVLTLDSVEITNINDATGDRTTNGGSVRVENNKLVFEPAGDFNYLEDGQNATVTVSYTVSDSNGEIATSTATITIAGTTSGVIATADIGETTENDALTVDVLANDDDILSNDVPTITGASVVEVNDANGIRTDSAGSISIVNQKLVFEPGADFDYLAENETATVKASYTIANANGESSSTTLTITVTGTNDAPVATVDVASAEQNTAITVDVLANDTDIDTNAVLALTGATVGSVTDFNGTRNNNAGSVSIVDNALMFDPGNDFDYLAEGESASVVVDYVVSDEAGGTRQSKVTITVTGTNEAPVAEPDFETITEKQLLTLDVVSNDLDPDTNDAKTLDSVQISNINDANGDRTDLGGSVSIVNNNLVFNPGMDFDYLEQGESATVTIDYSMSDPSGETSSSTATITVTGQSGPGNLVLESNHTTFTSENITTNANVHDLDAVSTEGGVITTWREGQGESSVIMAQEMQWVQISHGIEIKDPSFENSIGLSNYTSTTIDSSPYWDLLAGAVNISHYNYNSVNPEGGYRAQMHSTGGHFGQTLDENFDPNVKEYRLTWYDTIRTSTANELEVTIKVGEQVIGTQIIDSAVGGSGAFVLRSLIVDVTKLENAEQLTGLPLEISFRSINTSSSFYIDLIKFTKTTDELVPVDDAFQVNTEDALLGENLHTPKVITLDNGNYAVIWNVENSGDWGIARDITTKIKIFDADGNVVKDEFALTELHLNSDIIGLGNNFVVASVDVASSNLVVHFFNSEGNEEKVMTVDSIDNLDTAQVSIGELNDGKFAVVWRGEGENDTARVRLFDNSGNPITESISFGGDDFVNEGSISITTLSNGNFVTAYESGGALLFQLWDENGNQVGAPRNILNEGDTTSTVINGEIALTAIATGGFYATWNAEVEGSYEVYGHQFSNEGMPIGDVVLINENVQGDQSNSVVVNLPNGDVQALWLSETASGGVDILSKTVQVQNRVFDNAANGTVVGTVKTENTEGSENFTYAIADDLKGAFAIDQQTGVITVFDNTKLEVSETSLYNITVSVTDEYGVSAEQVFPISIMDGSRDIFQVSENSIISINPTLGINVELYHYKYDDEVVSAGLLGANADKGRVFIHNNNVYFDTNGDFDFLLSDETASTTLRVVYKNLSGQTNTIDYPITVLGGNDGPVFFQQDIVANDIYTLNVSSEGDQTQGDLTANQTNEVVSVFLSRTDSGDEIRLKKNIWHPNSGDSNVNEIVVNTTSPTGNQFFTNPEVAVSSNGIYGVVWSKEDPGTWAQARTIETYMKLFDADGNVVKDEFAINSGKLGATIEALDNGQFAIASIDSETFAVVVDIIDDQGDLLTQVNAGSAEGWGFAEPAITHLENGGFAVAWQTNTEQLNNKIKLFDKNGIAITDELDLGAGLELTSTNNIALEVLNNGDIVAVYSTTDGLYFDVLSSDGVIQNIATQVNDSTNNQLQASIVALKDGSFFVSWTQENENGVAEAIYGRQFFEDGTAMSSVFKVSDASFSENFDSRLTQASDGSIQVLWTATNDDADGKEIIARTINPQGYVLENVPNGTVVATVYASDKDTADQLFYTLIDDADGRFAIDESTGEIAVADQSKLNADENGYHNVTVQVRDQSGAVDYKTLTLIVNKDTQITEENTNFVLDVIADQFGGTGILTNVSIAEAVDKDGNNLEDQGSVTIVDGKLFFEPDTDFDHLATGEKAFVTVNYSVEDNNGTTNNYSTNITVEGTNDSPVIKIDPIDPSPSLNSYSPLTLDQELSQSAFFKKSLIKDGGFDAIDLPDGGVTRESDVWELTAGTYIRDMHVSNTESSYLTSEEYAAIVVSNSSSDGASISQVLDEKFNHRSYYEFSFDIAQEYGDSVQHPVYSFEFRVGGELVASRSSQNNEIRHAGYFYNGFKKAYVYIPSSELLELAHLDGQEVEISIVGHYVPNNTTFLFLDNVEGSVYTPELSVTLDSTVNQETLVRIFSDYSVSYGTAAYYYNNAWHNESVPIGATPSTTNYTSYTIESGISVSDFIVTSKETGTVHSWKETHQDGSVRFSIRSYDKDVVFVNHVVVFYDSADQKIKLSFLDEAGNLLQTDVVVLAENYIDSSLYVASFDLGYQVQWEINTNTDTDITYASRYFDEQWNAINVGDELLVDEYPENGTVIEQIFVTDAEGDNFTFSLIDDAYGRFTIDRNTGEIKVKNGANIHYETENQHTIIVRVTDENGSYSDSSYLIQVNNTAYDRPILTETLGYSMEATSLVTELSMEDYEEASISGQDNWVLTAYDNSVPEAWVEDGFGYDGSKAIRINQNFGSSTLTKVSNQIIPYLNETSILSFEMALKPSYLGTSYGIGADQNGDGVISENEAAFRVELLPKEGIIKLYKADGTVIEQIGFSELQDSWYNFKLDINLGANGGAGSATLYYKNVSQGETDYVTSDVFENVDFGLNPSAENAENPYTWNGIFIDNNQGFAGIDNIVLKSLPLEIINLDFNGYDEGDLSGQNGWQVETQNTANLVNIESSIGFTSDQTKAIRFNATETGAVAEVSKVNTSEDKILPDLNNVKSFTSEIDLLKNTGVTGFAFGSDMNYDGKIDVGDSSELGLKFEFSRNNNHELKIYLADGSTVSVNMPATEGWFRFKWDIDLDANNGAGSGTLSFKNLTNQDADWTTMEALTDMNLNLDVNASDASNAITWDGVYLSFEEGTSGADNLLITPMELRSDQQIAQANLVSDILKSEYIIDSDSNSSHGMAITSVDDRNGEWFYSTNKGSSWLKLDSAVVSDANALLLDGSSLIKFIANGAFSGNASFDFKAWDQTSGNTGEFLDTSSLTGSTAFSVETATASIAVVGNQPIITRMFSDAEGWLGKGDEITIKVEFSQAVAVTGIPEISFDSNNATYISGSGTNILEFSYQVPVTESGLDEILQPNAMLLNGGSIKGITGGMTDLTLPESDSINSLFSQSNLRIDTLSPNASLTSVDFYVENEANTLILKGSAFDSLLINGESRATDIASRLDWSKLSWSITAASGETATVSFVVDDIRDVFVVSDNTMYVRLHNVKMEEIRTTDGYEQVDSVSKLVITEDGFFKDAAGNIAHDQNLDGVAVTKVDELPSDVVNLVGSSGSDILQSGNADGNILSGGPGNDIMFGGFGQDTFKFNSGDGGTAEDPAVDGIRGFNVLEGDVLDLSDLLIDEENSDISQYLSFDKTGDVPVLEVRETAGGEITQKIQLYDLDLATLGASDAEILSNMIDNGYLNLDQ